MDNFAFASARQLRTALNDGVLISAQVLAVLQERKERKEKSGQALKGKSLALMNELLGIAAPAKAAKAAPVLRDADEGEAEAYAAKIADWSDKKIAQSARNAHLPWKKAALAAEIASRDSAPAAEPAAATDDVPTMAELEAMLANIKAIGARFDRL